MSVHPTFAQLFKTVFTPACDACGEPMPNNDDDILCHACRERLHAQAIKSELRVVDELRAV